MTALHKKNERRSKMEFFNWIITMLKDFIKRFYEPMPI